MINKQRMIRYFTFLFMMSCILSSCLTEKKNHPSEEQELEDIRITADSIASLAQFTLFKSVSNAMEKGGIEYAVDYCFINAIPISDSLSKSYKVEISRITDKPRNYSNLIHTPLDKQIYETFREDENLIDTLARNNHGYVYYKRINMAMPTCIKCHGTVGEEVDQKTYQKIKTHYPNDQAVGYRLNDYRALWKIEFDKKL